MRLFRRAPRSSGPADEAKGGSQPPRLVFGEDESIAFKRAQAAEAERKARERSDDLRRAHAASAQRLRWQRIEDSYPEAPEVLETIKTQIWSQDFGLPPKREQIEARAVEDLRRVHPDIPAEHVRAVFGKAVEAGLVRYRDRRWEWGREQAPEGRRPRSAIAGQIARLSVLLRPSGESVPAGAGTLLELADEPFCLTTATAWDTLVALGARVEIHLRRDACLEVDPDLIEASRLGNGLPGAGGPWGPDLALLRLPRMLRERLSSAGKQLYALSDAEPLICEDVLWAVAGSPLAARFTFWPARVRARARESYQGVELDYLDVDHRGPVLTGAGLFSVPLTESGSWTGACVLEGVAFRELLSEGDAASSGLRTVRCHGQKSVAALAGLPRLEKTP